MDCRRCRIISGRYLDGEATPAETEAFERHLRECPECARRHEDLRVLDLAHRGLRDVEPPAGLTERIVAAASAAGASRAPSGSGLVWKAVVAAAAAAVILLGIYAGSFITRSYLQEPAPRYAEVTGLEYLEDYPPSSFGEAIEVATGGVSDE